MDSLVIAAARALKAAHPLDALKLVALRNDAAALALRGIAMAQLGEFQKAKLLLRRAARAFGPRERIERARCLTAEAEVALASRELAWPTDRLEEARRIFASGGDHDNALHAALLQTRWLLLLGRVSEAADALGHQKLDGAPPMLRARAELVAFEIAIRRGETASARLILLRAQAAAQESGIGVLCSEVERAGMTLALPAARLIARGEERPLLLAEVESVLASQHLVIDACRRRAHCRRVDVSLARRPVLFALLRSLGQSWPGSVPRELLCQHAFGVHRTNESHRARLRVEIGRLRRALRTIADIRATQGGFALLFQWGEVLVLAPPIESPEATVLALLADGQAWSTSALSLALGSSQRTTQRALRALDAAGKVRTIGQGRARRWFAAPIGGFTTTLLLPVPPQLG